MRFCIVSAGAKWRVYQGNVWKPNTSITRFRFCLCSAKHPIMPAVCDMNTVHFKKAVVPCHTVSTDYCILYWLSAHVSGTPESAWRQMVTRSMKVNWSQAAAFNVRKSSSMFEDSVSKFSWVSTGVTVATTYNYSKLLQCCWYHKKCLFTLHYHDI
jgi:hypothetical protein